MLVNKKKKNLWPKRRQNIVWAFFMGAGPFDSFSSVDGVGSGAIAVVVLVNNVSIIIKKHNKNTPSSRRICVSSPSS